MIWKRHLSLEELNATSMNTLVAHLGIVYTRIGDDTLEAEMPVDARTHQPFGLLHGGASAALAETLGSMAGFLMTRDGQNVVGTELNATHHRAVSQGRVRGVCQPLHLGRSSQSWEIVVFDEQGRRCCTCRLSTMVLG
ncbi:MULTISPECIES: proofreading thioesterase EntH [Enterobacter]|uniref:proofreading thioesterase EntH n=1 Tax=Enterobacter TaxID=547 RepID=UPI003B84457B